MGGRSLVSRICAALLGAAMLGGCNSPNSGDGKAVPICGDDKVVPICGNGVADAEEVCDGADLRGATCASLGADGGAPNCNAKCTAITGCTHAPSTVADEATSEDGVAVTIDLVANDTDPDGDPLSLVWVGGASLGTVAIDGGKAVYTPFGSSVGVDSLNYRVSDGVTEAEGTVTVHVRQTLTIEGAVIVAGPVAGMDVMAWDDTLVDPDWTYSAQDGSYRVRVSSEFPDSLVRIFAVGGYLQLWSVPGTFAQLRALAGDDRVLTRAEHTGVNVTPATTGRYAALWANVGDSPRTAAQIVEAEQEGGPIETWSEAADAAAAILLIAEGTEQLPAGYITSFQLATDVVALRAFVGGVRAAAAPEDPITDAIQRLAADWQIRAPFAAAKVPDVWLPWAVRSHNGVISEGLERIVLEPSGSGSYQPFQNGGRVPPLEPLTWSLVSGGGALQLSFGEAVPTVDYLTATQIAAFYPSDPALQSGILTGVTSDVPVTRTLSSSTVERLAEGLTTDLVVRTDVWVHHLQEALQSFGIAAPDEVSTTFSVQPWSREAALTFRALDPALVTGTWAVPVHGTAARPSTYGAQAGADVFAHALVQISADGTATVASDDLSPAGALGWELLPSGALVLSYPDGSTEELRLWGEALTELGLLARHTLASGDVYVDYRRAVKVGPGFALEAGLLQNVPGQYWQSTINRAYFPLGPDGDPLFAEFLGFAFGPGEQLSRLYPGYADLDAATGPYVIDEDWWRYVISGGTAALELRYDGTGAKGCAMSDPSCVVTRRRTWTPVAEVGPWVYVVERELWRRNEWSFANGTYRWDATLGAWLDGTTPVDMSAWEQFVMPRLQAYYVTTVPQP